MSGFLIPVLHFALIAGCIDRYTSRFSVRSGGKHASEETRQKLRVGILPLYTLSPKYKF